MERVNWLSAACAVGLFAVGQQGLASPSAQATKQFVDGSLRMVQMGASLPKAASAQTLGSRAMVTSSDTVYGGFELSNTTTVYVLVRGNSLGTLGITQDYLDAPRVRLYNAQGQDLINDEGRPGFNFCLSSSSTDLPVINYYQNVRGQPVHSGDACLAAIFPAGAYTFSVTPSIPGVTTDSTSSSPPFGEMLFEVTLNP